MEYNVEGLIAPFGKPFAVYNLSSKNSNKSEVEGFLNIVETICIMCEMLQYYNWQAVLDLTEIFGSVINILNNSGLARWELAKLCASLNYVTLVSEQCWSDLAE